jgi:4-amino-4-deoxy-L-arabinose transferase-like glycosyltransferase
VIAIENIQSKTKYTLYFILAAVLYFVFFHRLGTYPIRTWDESVYAVYSYEMMESGNYIVPHLNGQIDYLNDKPPLFFWCQIASIKLFGYNEFAVRFPSAMFGALTVLMLFLFIAKRFSFYLGLCVAFVLSCSVGFVTFHSSRTGDMDTMLAFGLTGSVLCLVAYLKDQRTKYLLGYFVFVLFSFFTKSIAGLFFIPAHLLIIAFSKRELLKDLKLWLGFGLSLGLIAIYFVIRGKYEPGYFSSHFTSYLGKFKSHFNDSHIKPWDFYINNLFSERFSTFILAVIPSAILVWFEKSPELKQLLVVASISALIFFAIICISPTKCYWYDVPLFPMLALLTGYFIWKVLGFVNIQIEGRISMCLLLVALFFPAIYYAVKRSYNNQIPQQERRLEVVHDFFTSNFNDFPYQKMKIINDNYISPMLFYKYKYGRNNIELVICNTGELQTEDIVITGNDSIKSLIQKNYNTETVQTYKQATVYKIK